MEMAKYTKPLDHDDEEKGDNWKYRLPFALCKEKGISLPDNAAPRDAWNALKGIGINPDDEYENAIRERRKKYFQLNAKAKAKRKREEAKEHKKQSYDPEHSPDYTYTPKPNAIAGVKKGQPMSFEKANGGSPNPYYYKDAVFGGKLYGYTTNCQTCVVVFEARQRGYDVRALPNNRNPYINDLQYKTNLAYIDKNGNNPLYIVPSVRERKNDFVEENVKDGRYTLQFVKGGSGHIVSVQRINGKITIYDPQTGFRTSNTKEYLRDKSRLKMLRVDNVDFDPQYVNYIMKGI